MKTTKKIVLAVVVLALLLTAALGMVACNKNPVQLKDTAVIVPLDSKVMSDIEGKHLIDYLNVLQDKGYLTYNAPGGFIDTINDLKADASQNEYWFIYTDDEANANADWGTYDLDGKTLGSAMYGITDLPLKEGATYVFVVSKYEY